MCEFLSDWLTDQLTISVYVVYLYVSVKYLSVSVSVVSPSGLSFCLCPCGVSVYLYLYVVHVCGVSVCFVDAVVGGGDKYVNQQRLEVSISVFLSTLFFAAGPLTESRVGVGLRLRY